MPVANPVPKRLVFCTGSIQLITAVAVLRQIRAEAPSPPARPEEDWLVISHLTASGAEEARFARYITQLARACWTWGKIIFLDNARMGYLDTLRYTKKPEVYRQRVQEFLTLPEDAVGTLVLNLNWLPATEMALMAYPRARRVCCGDGLGFYYPEYYFMPPRFFEGHARPAGEDWRSFHEGYFITDRLARCPKPPMPYKLRGTGELLAVLEELAAAQDLPIVDRLAWELGGNPFVLFLPSNFSESKRMTREAEIDGYIAHLRANPPPPGAPILLKPHPRDSREKIGALAEALRLAFGTVHVLDNPTLFFLPLELLLLRLGLDSNSTEAQRRCPAAYTYSSACASLVLLWGIQVHLGFGEEAVRHRFHPDFQDTRIAQEEDMRDLMEVLRQTTPFSFSDQP